MIGSSAVVLQASKRRRTENVGISVIIVAELKFRNVRRQIFLQRAAFGFADALF
jgi:hypothetical protein